MKIKKLDSKITPTDKTRLFEQSSVIKYLNIYFIVIIIIN